LSHNLFWVACTLLIFILWIKFKISYEQSKTSTYTHCCQGFATSIQAPPAPPAPAKNKFDAKAYAKNGVPEEEVNVIKLAFDLFDTDQGGSIDIKG